MSGTSASCTVEGATKQDRTIGRDTLGLLRARDCVVRDMGYSNIEEFQNMDERQIKWLSRLSLTTRAYLMNGKPLEKRLESATENVVDCEVEVGKKARFKCRLVAVRADEKVASEHRRNRNANAQKQRKTASADALVRDGWHIMITSFTAEEASPQGLALLYSARWSIELQFRAFKKEIHLQKALSRKNGEHLHLAFIISALIAQQLSLKYWNLYAPTMEEEGRMLSLEKMVMNCRTTSPTCGSSHMRKENGQKPI